MKSSLTSFFLSARIYRENPLDLVTIYKSKDLINAQHSRTCCRSIYARLCNTSLFKYIADTWIKTYKKLTCHDILRHHRSFVFSRNFTYPRAFHRASIQPCKQDRSQC